MGELVDGFENRAFGVLLFVSAVPVALPVAIRGISAVLGMPLLLLPWQLIRGRDNAGIGHSLTTCYAALRPVTPTFAAVAWSCLARGLDCGTWQSLRRSSHQDLVLWKMGLTMYTSPTALSYCGGN